MAPGGAEEHEGQSGVLQVSMEDAHVESRSYRRGKRGSLAPAHACGMAGCICSQGVKRKGSIAECMSVTQV